MKRIITIVLILAILTSLTACSTKEGVESPSTDSEMEATSNEDVSNDYDVVVQEINKSKGAKDIWDKYRDDKEAQEFILINIEDGSIGKLITKHDELHGSSISYTEEMGKILTLILDLGVDKVSAEKVKTALTVYMNSQDKSNDEVDEAINKVGELYKSNPEELNTFIENIVNGLGSVKDVETLLLNDALDKEKKKLINSLKNPKSFDLLSLNGTNVEYDNDTNEFVVLIVIEYTASNSFGGETKDTYTSAVKGTYIDGVIHYK